MGQYWPVKNYYERMKMFLKTKSKNKIPLVPIETKTEHAKYIAKLVEFSKATGCDIELSTALISSRHMFEYKRKTIYVPSSLVKWLSACEFDADVILNESTPFGDVYAISFEKGSEIDGVTLKSCFINHVFYGTQGLEIVIPIGYEKNQKSFTRYLFERAQSSILNKNIGCKKLDIYGAYQFAVLAINMYVRAFPECLNIGPPSHDEKISGIKQFTLTPPKDKRIIGEHGSPCAHWRRGHFRVLRDERFSRNEDGSCRVIFVHDCIVAQKDQEIYHVSDDDREPAHAACM